MFHDYYFFNVKVFILYVRDLDRMFDQKYEKLLLEKAPESAHWKATGQMFGHHNGFFVEYSGIYTLPVK